MGQTDMHERGYSLIELLLYVTIVGVLLTSIVSFFAVVSDVRVRNQTVSEVNDQAAVALRTIATTVRGASSISSPAAGVSDTQLTVTVPTGSLSPTVFSLSGTQLMMKEGAAAAVPLTSSGVQVTALSVKNLTRSGTSGIVQISLTMNRLNPAGRSEFTYQKTYTTSVGLRP